jgi:hypothetical protein
MSESPAEDAAEQGRAVSDDDAEDAQDTQDYAHRGSDEVDPADAVEQSREVPDDEDDRR